MFFDIHTLERKQIRFDEVFHPGSIDFLDESLKQASDLHAAGVAELVDPFGAREIRVHGSIEGELEVLCARCLEPVRLHLAQALDLFYRPMGQIARDEEIEISQAELEVGFYQGSGIELADVVREQVTIELPIRSVCREECRGICPICGKNRNIEACTCREEFHDPRWESLVKWKN